MSRDAIVVSWLMVFFSEFEQRFNSGGVPRDAIVVSWLTVSGQIRSNIGCDA